MWKVEIVPCPAPNCPYQLDTLDTHRATHWELAAKHRALLAVEYQARLDALDAEDADFANWTRANARTCPACRVIIHRDDGCNSMVCTCGEGFCYECGQSNGDDECVCCNGEDEDNDCNGRVAGAAVMNDGTDASVNANEALATAAAAPAIQRRSSDTCRVLAYM